jgi:hypothetical protein
MTPPLSLALQTLHDLLRQLTEAEGRLTEGPRSIAVADRQVKAGEDQVEQQKQAIKTARKTADEQNLKLKSKEAELLKLQGQLNTAASNKEYEIINHQLAAAKKEKGDIEDTALTAMDAIDASQKRLKELEAALQQRKKDAQQTKTTVEQQAPGLKAAVEALESQIAAAEKDLPGADSVALFRRLRKAHGAGSLAVIDGQSCSGCDHLLTSQDMVRLRTGEFVCCRGCARILYLA